MNSSTTDPSPRPRTSAPTTGAPWWRDAVIYQVYPRSFADSDGDGLGDLSGIRARLPYLADLGVDAIWINPFYPSPQADAGYDVADYRDIEPLFGTLEDADALLTEAHALGLRVILDLVPNHTSEAHVWFQEALASAPGSAARSRYHFRDGQGANGAEPPNDWDSVFGGNAWTRTSDGQWYLHLFAPEQPDLNWSNPEVHEELLSVLRFWLDRGADGFRIDVAHGMAKDLALPDLGEEKESILEPTKRTDHPHWDRDEVHDIYRDWRAVTDSYDGDRLLVAEAWVATPQRLARYLRPDELHTAFNFDFLKAEWTAPVMRRVIEESMRAGDEVGAPTTWVLSNHDVTRHATRYAEGDRARGLRRARAATLLMLALPGGAYVYQGEELGLFEVEDLPEASLQDPTWERSGHTIRGRDGCRVPIPWSEDGPSYGFGPGGSWLPQPLEWAGLSVEAQRGEPGSTLELYREALRLRKAEPVLGEGPMEWVSSEADVLALRRTGDGPAVVCLVNFGSEAVDLPPASEVLLASGTVEGVLPGDTAVWLRG